MPAPNNILLGDGVFSIGGHDVALTRGGGKFAVKRELKQIEADGDFGPVKGRLRKIKSVATLELGLLEIEPTYLNYFYAAMTVASIAASDTLSGASDVASSDYRTVTWTGKTLDGREVVITLENAINLDGPEWDLKDKDESVPKIVMTATYLEAARTTEPWNVVFATATGDDAVAPVMTIASIPAGTWTEILLTFNEKLHADTYAITDIANLLYAISNSGVSVACTTVANSIVWMDTLTQNPKCLVKIPSTVFVAATTVTVNAKTNAIKDTSSNKISQASDFTTVVTV
jgi:hypothetical protein